MESEKPKVAPKPTLKPKPKVSETNETESPTKQDENNEQKRPVKNLRISAADLAKLRSQNRHFDYWNRPQDETQLKYDVREDPEQIEKMKEIAELFVESGYYRARVTKLSDFDKVIGGLCWAILMAFDAATAAGTEATLDVDLFYQDNLTIGQKLALTEKVVKVLRAMECPHPLEPHQIQGLDCIHILPVVQWLIRRSRESRAANAATIRAFANWQFCRSFDAEPIHLPDPLSAERSLLEAILNRRGIDSESDDLLERQFRRKEARLRSAIESRRSELEVARQKWSSPAELERRVGALKEKVAILDEKLSTLGKENEDGSAERLVKSELLARLRRERTQFKQHCRAEQTRLEGEVARLTSRLEDATQDGLEAELGKLLARHDDVRKELSAVTQRLVSLERRFAEVPSRTELAQYQKRFLELYGQLATKHNETKKFYAMYNVLTDERDYLEKQFRLINSILDSFQTAQHSSQTVKDDFLLKFEQTINSILQNRNRVEQRLTSERARRERLQTRHTVLVGQQRQYAQAVKTFKEEIARNELLVSQLASS